MASEPICKKHTMFSQSISPNGGCLFTSLGLNYVYLNCLLNNIKIEVDLNGMEKNSVLRGFKFRLLVVHWLQNNLENEVKQLGNFIDKEENLFKVRNILNLELARKEDLPNEIEKQNKMIYEYLLEMCNYDTWGSTPEYIAFSIVTGIAVHVWRRESDGLVLNDSFPKDLPELDNVHKNEIHLLFCNGNHYEPLVKKSILDELEVKNENTNIKKYFTREFNVKF
jgi:hypothetical protein